MTLFRVAAVGNDRRLAQRPRLRGQELREPGAELPLRKHFAHEQGLDERRRKKVVQGKLERDRRISVPAVPPFRSAPDFGEAPRDNGCKRRDRPGPARFRVPQQFGLKLEQPSRSASAPAAPYACAATARAASACALPSASRSCRRTPDGCAAASDHPARRAAGDPACAGVRAPHWRVRHVRRHWLGLRSASSWSGRY